MIKNNPENYGGGTSFWGITFCASVSEIFKAIGQPACQQNDGRDKTNFDWVCKTSTGKIFTIYDWKYYRPLSLDENIRWNIGGLNRQDTSEAYTEIKAALNTMKTMVKSRDNITNGRDGYYDEFPDAYGQNL